MGSGLDGVGDASLTAGFAPEDLDALDRSVVVTDTDGRITFWSAGAKTLYGWNPEEVVGRHVFDVFGGGPEPDAARSGLERLRAGTPRSGEFAARHRDGRSFVVDFINVPIREAGHVVAFVGFSSDRSAERAAAAELRESRERLEMTTAQGRVGTWRTDVRTGRTSWDAGLERIFDVVPGTFGGGFEHFLALVHPDDREEVSRIVRAALEDGDEYVLEHRPNLPGPTRWVEGRGRVIRDEEGRALFTVGVAIDVTDRKRAELALAAQSHSLQQRLLQVTLPEIEGLDLAARYASAGELDVGGDWYDAIDLGGGLVVVAVGDVMGRGVEAASVMGQVRLGFRAYALEELPPAEILRRLGRLVASLDTESFSTLVVAAIDVVAGTISWANAGHPPLVLHRADGAVETLVGWPSPPVGIGRERPTETTVSFGPGDFLVAYTDGLVERRDVPIAEGIERLEDAVALMTSASPSVVADCLLELAGGTDDDVAIVVARRRNPE